MPRNPLVVDTLTHYYRVVHEVDANDDGTPDGLCTLIYWSLHDLPYPDVPAPFTGFDALGPREREQLETLGMIAERADVEVVRIRGHTSEEGSEASNQALAQRRVDAVLAQINAIRAADPTLDLRVAADVVLEPLGEDEPHALVGEIDHPLNRRIDLGFRVTRRIPKPVPSEVPSRNWRIGFDQSFSAYRIVGGQIGVGTLKRLDNQMESVQSQDFWYFAGGVGYELGGKLSGAAGRARAKLAAKQPLDNLDRAAVWADDAATKIVKRLDGMVPDNLQPAIAKIRGGWKQVTDNLGSHADWDQLAPEQKTARVLENLGISSVTSFPFVNGTFQTATPRVMAQMDLCPQVLLQATVSGPQVALNGAFGLTLVALFIPDPVSGGDGEWVTALIVEAAVDAGLIPSPGEAGVSLTFAPMINFR